jgi:hypothetical protein
VLHRSGGIVGFIPWARAHRAQRDCLAGWASSTGRLIEVEWDVAEPAKRPVRVAVYIGADRPGLSRSLSHFAERQHHLPRSPSPTTARMNHFVIRLPICGNQDRRRHRAFPTSSTSSASVATPRKRRRRL